VHAPARLLAALVASAATAACNPFVLRSHGGAPRPESDARAAMRVRLEGPLVASAPAPGAAPLTGTVVASPGLDGGSTYVAVALANASPGSAHPWRIHRGRCDADGGVLGPADAFDALVADGRGRASGSATLPLVIGPDATYHVRVGDSAARAATVACADLASPPGR
jgi:hypothetical protein